MAEKELDVEKAIGSAFISLMASATREGVIEDAARIATLMAEEVARLLPGTGSLIGLVSSEPPHDLRVSAVAGDWPAGTDDARWPVEGTILGRAFRQGSALEVVEPAAGLTPVGVVGDAVLRVIPLVAPEPLADGRPGLGCLLLRRRGEHPFTAEEQHFLDIYGRLIGMSLFSNQHTSELSADAIRLELMLEIALDIGSSLDQRDVVDRILQRAVEVTGADRASVARVEEGILFGEGGYDRAGLVTNTGIQMPIANQPAFRDAVASKQPVLDGVLQLDVLPGELRPVWEGVRHSLVTPLLRGGKVTGLLILSRRSDPAFGNGDVITLQFLASVAALALRNARLYERMSAARDEMGSFLNLVVHELRAPMTVINGYIDLMRTGALGEVPGFWKKPLGTVADKSAELQQLVEDLLLAARVESGGIPMHPEPVDLRTVVTDALERAAPRADLFEAQIEPMLPATAATVLADPGQLGLIIDNLVNNALIHGGQRRSSITVEVQSNDPSQVIVQDHGAGIAPEHRDRIFERFFRIDERAPGTGLGLHISRELARRNGGELRLLTSEMGRGSRFALILPKIAS